MKKTLLLVLLVLIDLVLLHGQNPTIKARYEMKDVAGFSGKVGIVESFVLEVGKEKKRVQFVKIKYDYLFSIIQYLE